MICIICNFVIKISLIIAYKCLKSSYVLLLDILDIVISEYGMDSQRIKNVIFQFEIKSR